jgi:NDP-sugar pyrophosphorylase family protein
MNLKRISDDYCAQIKEHDTKIENKKISLKEQIDNLTNIKNSLISKNCKINDE